MEGYDEKLKKSLDNHFFNQLNLSETEAAQFAITIIEKSMKSKSKKTFKKFIAPAVAAFCMVMILSVLLWNLIIDSKSVSASIEKIAVGEFGKSVVIPELEEYPIIFSAITKPAFLDNPSDLTISYGNEKGEIDPRFKSDNQQKKWEKEQESLLLYGPYLGKEVINIQYRPGRLEFGNSGVQKKVINGMTVEYEHFKRDAGEFVLVNINTKVGGYSVQMRITDGFTLSDSEQVLEEITKQLKDL
ncbi:hypothetical protein [Neobacillus sp. D3-1R]|uniref:hypothetical protein n=1 Tax=Neobacillus sp. D3-1R TaxID=3445778 RepID=UPI003F9FF913